MPKGVKVTLPASAACVLFALLLYVDVHPWLRGGFGWRWFHQPAPAARTLLLAGLVAGYVAGGYALLRWTRRGVWALLWALAGSVALALGVIYLKHDNLGYELFVRTASMVATGQHHAAANLDLDLPTLRGWAAQMADFDPEDETISRHVLLAPPGIPLFYEGLNGLLGQFPALAERLQLSVLLYQCQNYALLAYSAAEWASAWFGMLMPLWAALTVFPVYGVARQLDIPAREAALWWALVPMPAAFAGSWNTVYPLLAITAFAVFLRGLRRDGPAWVALSGGMVGLLTFMNFAPVPVLGVFGVYTLLHYFVPGAAENNGRVVVPAGGGALRRSVVTGAVFGAGLALPWVVWMGIGGDAPVGAADRLVWHAFLARPALCAVGVFAHV